MNTKLIQKYIETVTVNKLPEGILRALERYALKWSETNEQFLKDQKAKVESEIADKNTQLADINDKISQLPK